MAKAVFAPVPVTVRNIKIFQRLVDVSVHLMPHVRPLRFCTFAFQPLQAKVTVSATVKPRMYLHFPDLDPDATGKPRKLQIGFCYMPGLASSSSSNGAAAHQQPQQQQQHGATLAGRGKAATYCHSEIVRPLRVRNVSDRKLYLTCTPNLRKQCFVYAAVPSDSLTSSAAGGGGGGGGEEGSGGGGDWSAGVPNRPQLADLPLLPQSETTLYIGLRPVLPPEAYTAG